MTIWTKKTPTSATWEQTGVIKYIITEALEFLMTEANENLITEDSVSSVWSKVSLDSSSWTKITPS